MDRLLRMVPIGAHDDFQEVKRSILQSSRIILCTIASTSRLLREWRDVVDVPLQVLLSPWLPTHQLSSV